MSNAGSSYGCDARRASTASARRSSGTTVSTPELRDRLLPPALADAGAVPSPPKNVPVPAVYHEQRS